MNRIQNRDHDEDEDEDEYEYEDEDEYEYEYEDEYEDEYVLQLYGPNDGDGLLGDDHRDIDQLAIRHILDFL